MAGISGLSSDSVLRGLYGSIVNSATQGLSTAEVWSQLRTAAQDWATSILGVTSSGAPAVEDIQAEADRLMSGVSAADVSRYRGIAGQQLGAAASLAEKGLEHQITASDIFRPPWAVTVGQAAVQERYRIRVNWDVQVKGFATVERQEWATWDLQGPITNMADALRQATSAFAATSYNRSATVTGINSYQIEAV